MSAGQKVKVKKLGTRGWFWAAIVLAAVLLVGAVFAAVIFSSSNSTQPRFLSTSESELVAIARFQNFSQGTRELSISVDTHQGLMLAEGYFDYETGAGIAELRPAGNPLPTHLIWWNTEVMGEIPLSQGNGVRLSDEIPPLDAASGWVFAPTADTVGTQLGQVLLFAAMLHADRPENPKLLEQSDALMLGEGMPAELFDWGEGFFLPQKTEGTHSDPGMPPYFWVQLPSADEVRPSGSVPAEELLRPKLLVDSNGVVWRAEILHRASNTVAATTYGSASEVEVPQPLFGVPSE